MHLADVVVGILVVGVEVEAVPLIILEVAVNAMVADDITVPLPLTTLEVIVAVLQNVSMELMKIVPALRYYILVTSHIFGANQKFAAGLNKNAIIHGL